MNQIVQNLEARGIVKRVGSETHGKIMNTMITKVGLALLEKAKALVLAVEEEVFGRLSPAEIKSLSVLLKKLSERP
jgi:DNA-binding MarR family transcriptional regulator